jgi:hypothetical protein
MLTCKRSRLLRRLANHSLTSRWCRSQRRMPLLHSRIYPSWYRISKPCQELAPSKFDEDRVHHHQALAKLLRRGSTWHEHQTRHLEPLPCPFSGQRSFSPFVPFVVGYTILLNYNYINTVQANFNSY